MTLLQPSFPARNPDSPTPSCPHPTPLPPSIRVYQRANPTLLLTLSPPLGVDRIPIYPTPAPDSIPTRLDCIAPGLPGHISLFSVALVSRQLASPSLNQLALGLGLSLPSRTSELYRCAFPPLSRHSPPQPRAHDRATPPLLTHPTGHTQVSPAPASHVQRGHCSSNILFLPNRECRLQQLPGRQFRPLSPTLGYRIGGRPTRILDLCVRIPSRGHPHLELLLEVARIRSGARVSTSCHCTIRRLGQPVG